MLKVLALLATLFTASAATAAPVAYTVLAPLANGADNFAQITNALAGPLPVLLSAGEYPISKPLQVKTKNMLICENSMDGGGTLDGAHPELGNGLTRIVPRSNFSGTALVILSGSDPMVKGCNVTMQNAPATPANCFQIVDGTYGATLDHTAAMFCGNHGLEATSNGGNIVFTRIQNGAIFYNSTHHAIHVGWDSQGGYTSDFHVDNAYVAANCKGGCDDGGDIYLFGTNGAIRNTRQEWSSGDGDTLYSVGIFLMEGNYFDRTGGSAIVVVGKSNVSIQGGLIQGAMRANNYEGPAIQIIQDQFGNCPYTRSNTDISVWSVNGSQYQSDCSGDGRLDTKGHSITPVWPNTYQDQASHDFLDWEAVSPY